jgi:amino acid adenylation domain-containing protein
MTDGKPLGFEPEVSPGRAGTPTAADAVFVSEDLCSFPLAPVQESLWFMEHYLGGGAVFTLNHAYRLRSPVDPALFELGLNEIVRRHESMRTTFRVVDGEPAQVVAKEFRLTFPVLDFSNLPPEEAEERAMEMAAEDARAPFDLGVLPLFRVKLLRLTKDQWVFLQTMHHIISDGWSIVVFWREMQAVMRALQAGKPSPLSELPIQYGDFASWQREWLRGPALEEQIAYWKRQLAGARLFDLPGDRPRPESGHTSAGLHRFFLPPSLVSSIRAVSHRARATLFMTLLCAFYVLLHRYTGERDIAIGSYVAGRSRAELEQLIGLFLNTIVLRADLGGRPSFLGLLDRVKNMTLDACAHQDVPFVRLVQELQPPRDLNRHPFFEIVFQMLNLPAIKEGIQSLDPPQLVIHRGAAAFDLTCTLWESGETVNGHLEYNTELFDAATIERFVEHYRTLLGSIAADADQRISELPFLTIAEQRRALGRWNAAQPKRPSEGLTQLLERQAESSPDGIAIIDGARRIGYRDLNRRANQLAWYLRARGAGPESIAVICLDRSLEAVIAIVAVIKTGAAFLPLDAAHPPERLRQILQDSRAQFVIAHTSGAFAEDCPATVICLDAERQRIERENESGLGIAAEPESLACVLYTSGSSGRPKGVALEHRQILNRLWWMWTNYPFRSGERTCQKTPLNFIDSLWELFGPLLAGVPAVIISNETLKDLRSFIEAVASNAVTRIWIFPSFLRTLVELTPDLRAELPALDFWVSTGEELSADLVAAFRVQMPQATLYNLYGTSEVWDAAWYDTAGVNAAAARVPIGLPIDYVRCYILDSELQIAATGVAGELYVGGAGVSRGYLNQPALTAEKFIPDPFSREPGSRLYRTGDLARWRRDGAIEFIGRRDRQIKIRGFRVDPSEIESILSRHPGVARVAVMPESVSGLLRLRAYVTLRSGAKSLGADLNAFLKQTLPDSFTPALYTFVDCFPLLPNGKLDRSALVREAKPVDGEGPSRLGELATSTEEEIGAIWQNVLKLPKMGVHDSFFDLGGHSLLLMSVKQKLAERFPIEVTMLDLFRYPTIRSLAAFVERVRVTCSGGQS